MCTHVPFTATPRLRRESFRGPSKDEHGVAEGVEAVPLFDGEPVEPARLLDAGEGHHERQQGRAREVEVREEGVDAAELEARRDEEGRAAGARGASSERLEDADGR